MLFLYCENVVQLWRHVELLLKDRQGPQFELSVVDSIRKKMFVMKTILRNWGLSTSTAHS